MERVLSYEEALDEVLREADTFALPGQTQHLDLLEAQGRVLATAVLADRDQPPFARSTRDGFAVRSADLVCEGDPATVLAPLQVIGLVRAGERWTGAPVTPGTAVEIMTGAPVPAGADAVLMLEHAGQTAPGGVQPASGRQLAAGENVVPAGAEARAGDTLIPAGRLLGAAEIGLAASCGMGKVDVFRSPVVAIVATGDELVELHESPAAWQIRNSNSYALAALVGDEGAVAHRLPTARDNAEDLRQRLQEAMATADLLLFSGGVSMGKYDLVEEALREAGATFFFTGARIQPGKPVVFGRLAGPDGKTIYFFGLPGNPVSTEVCFRLFVAPLLRALCGRSDRAPRFAEAQLAETARGSVRVTRFLPALIAGDWQGVSARIVPWHGSGDLAANGRANGFLVLPAEVEIFEAGARVRVLLR